jgi:Fe-S-cluster-containing dehydrogenase component/DMSO reductase anchor subunit
MVKLVNDYLHQQQDMTAVEKFAFRHDMRQLPEQDRLYTDLIPKVTPGPGQQYAFEVDLDQCTGCKACVTACHSENGLDEDETWRSVGLLQGGTTQAPDIQHVSTACHHCLDPACLNGCPVLAYEKSPTTGVVKHLEDQCIGCQYCTFTCAYNVPKYSKKKGIVHKCDMCISRLEVGQAPACVRACPSGAIRIKLVDVARVRENPTEYVNIPDAPDSHYTLPTTRYLRKKEFSANMASADFYSLKTEHSHLPLVVMLVLTQLSVGAFIALLFLANSIQTTFHMAAALGAGILALGASVFHLGRPQYAFRAIIGLKKSWLSREIVAFGVFALSAALYIWSYALNSITWITNGLALSTVISGLFGVFASVMVYRYTKRPFWDNFGTTLKFFMTTGILGAAMVLWVKPFNQICFVNIAAMSIIKLSWEAASFLTLRDAAQTSLKKTALLMITVLKKVTIWRFVCGIIGGVGLPIVLLSIPMAGAATLFFSTMIFILLLAGEFLERYLFFKAVVPLQMPGAHAKKN